jgi:hypothetical protein
MPRFESSNSVSEIACRLAGNAEQVCRHYLSNGRREGHYWLAGDVHNNVGRSLFVRLTGPTSGKGATGKWTDAATGEHGDLLDLIALTQGLGSMSDVLREAQIFLNLPQTDAPSQDDIRQPSSRSHTPDAARRLFSISQPITGTIAETYLHHRSIHTLHETGALRFHPRCYFRQNTGSARQIWPALIAAVTDLDGALTAVHRTWLDRSGPAKAPVETPRRAMGNLLGHGVRFGTPEDVLAAGEGIETMLSLRCVLPNMPVIAALSANHLAALLLPPMLRRLYIACDNDPAGNKAAGALADRAQQAGIEAIMLSPRLSDFNDDLQRRSSDDMRADLRTQLSPLDVACFVAR